MIDLRQGRDRRHCTTNGQAGQSIHRFFVELLVQLQCAPSVGRLSSASAPSASAPTGSPGQSAPTGTPGRLAQAGKAGQSRLVPRAMAAADQVFGQLLGEGGAAPPQAAQEVPASPAPAAAVPAVLATQPADVVPEDAQPVPTPGQSEAEEDDAGQSAAADDESQAVFAVSAAALGLPSASDPKAAATPGQALVPFDAGKPVHRPPKGLTVPAGGWQGRCWFECGAEQDLLNIGNQFSVRLVCGPCNAARRQLDAQARRAEAEVRHELADLKKNRQSEYKDKIRAARLIPGGGGSAWGQAQARRELFAQWSQSLTVKKEVREISAVEWKSRLEYLAYCRMTLGQSPAEAEASWQDALRNPNWQRRGAGDSIRIAVQATPRTEASSATALERSIGRSFDLDPAGPAGQAALAQVATGMSPAALPDFRADAFAGMDRSAFNFGAASATTGQSDPLAHLSLHVGETSVQSVVSVPHPSAQLAPLTAGPGATPRRTRQLKAAVSDVDGCLTTQSKAEIAKQSRTVCCFNLLVGSERCFCFRQCCIA